MLDGPVIAEWLPSRWRPSCCWLIAAGVAGWVDAVVGGGGLIQLPALVIAVPKDVATPFILGTNKLSSFFGTLSASWVYLRKIRVAARPADPPGGGGVRGLHGRRGALTIRPS